MEVYHEQYEIFVCEMSDGRECTSCGNFPDGVDDKFWKHAECPAGTTGKYLALTSLGDMILCQISFTGSQAEGSFDVTGASDDSIFEPVPDKRKFLTASDGIFMSASAEPSVRDDNEATFGAQNLIDKNDDQELEGGGCYASGVETPSVIDVTLNATYIISNIYVKSAFDNGYEMSMWAPEAYACDDFDVCDLCGPFMLMGDSDYWTSECYTKPKANKIRIEAKFDTMNLCALAIKAEKV
jgi:hypothetical protein